MPGPSIAMTPDAAVEFALNVLNAAYFARNEQAAYQYTKRHSINTEEFLKLLRNGS